MRALRILWQQSLNIVRDRMIIIEISNNKKIIEIIVFRNGAKIICRFTNKLIAVKKGSFIKDYNLFLFYVDWKHVVTYVQIEHYV